MFGLKFNVFKKFLLLFFVAALFSGCSNLVSNENIKGKSTVIKFSAWGSQSETEILKPLLKDFEKANPNIKVEFMHIPQNYFQKLHLLFASNLAPDVVFLNNFYSQKYIKAGLLEDLTPYFESELQEEIFFSKAIQSSSYKNRLYVVPRDISDVVVYYNKDFFKEKHLPYPHQNWTIEEFVEIAQKLSGEGKWGVGFEKDSLYWLPFLFSNGASLLSEDGSKFELDEPDAQKSLQQYSDIVNKYHSAPDKAQSASLTMAQLFIQGRLAMQISGRWLVPKYRNEIKFDWDVVNFPKGTKGSVTGIDSSGYAVAKASSHKTESVKLIKYLSSKNSLEKLSKSGLIVPARKDAAYSDEFLAPDQKPKNAPTFLNAIETGKVTPVNESYQKITDNLNKALEPVFLGRKSVKEVVDALKPHYED